MPAMRPLSLTVLLRAPSLASQLLQKIHAVRRCVDLCWEGREQIACHSVKIRLQALRDGLLADLSGVGRER